MKIILCGGGTSGHVHPALAIAEAVKRKYPGTEFLFIGRAGGFENRSVTKAKIPLITLKVEGISRSISTKNIKRIGLALKAVKEAEKIIKDFSPDLVLGTGGYVSYPVIKAAQRLKIKNIIHESNVYPGLVTRLLAKGSDCILLNYQETKEYLSKKANTHVVGNPLRADFTKTTRDTARAELGLSENDIFILSFGGSGGAKKLNDTVCSLMEKNMSYTPNVYHLHAVGNKYFENYKNTHLEKSLGRCKIVPFIDDMPKYLSAADIVISRSGAMSTSEISLVGRAAIFIPSPNVTNNHQYKNAKLLSDKKACILIEEKDLNEELLRSKIELLINDSDLRRKMSKRIKKFSSSNAAERAAEKIGDICG